MIVLSGQRLISTEWETISPLVHPLKTIIFSLPICLFVFLSLHFLRRLNSGSTIVCHPKRYFSTFKVISGKYQLSSKEKSQGYIKSYNGPVASAILGLLLFLVSQILLVMLFKQPNYYFVPFA